MELLTAREAATRLSLKEATIYRWIFDKKLGTVRIGTRSIRIPVSEIDRIITEGTTAAAVSK